MPSTVNVTPNRMVCKTLLRTGGIRLRKRTFSPNSFARGIRFVRAFDTGPIKGRSQLEQRQSQPGAKELRVRRKKIISQYALNYCCRPVKHYYCDSGCCAQERDFHLRFNRRSVGRVHCIRFG